MLDGRPVRTPEKALMAAPTEEMAEAIAREWQNQTTDIQPDTMPLTQLLTTCIDRVTPQRSTLTTGALAYLDSDLLCYQADDPEPLRQELERKWTPWLDWCANRFGTRPQMTHALTRLDQPPPLRKTVTETVEGLNIHEFTVFQAVTALTGSVILALAFIDNAITPQETWKCALCEELFYERHHDLEKHGLDPVEQKRRDTLTGDLEAAAKYLALSAPTTS